MSFGLYITGFVIVVAGLIYGAVLMHIPAHWIVVGGIVLLGIKNSDRSESDSAEGFGALDWQRRIDRNRTSHLKIHRK